MLALSKFPWLGGEGGALAQTPWVWGGGFRLGWGWTVWADGFPLPGELRTTTSLYKIP